MSQKKKKDTEEPQELDSPIVRLLDPRSLLLLLNYLMLVPTAPPHLSFDL